MKVRMRYVDVLLPLSLGSAFTYILPEEYEKDIREGMRVVVPFGKRKIYTALVYSIHNNKPENFEPKEILTLLDSVPIVRKAQMKFWEWIANYYQCTLGEIFKAAVPSGLKLESETIINIVEDFIAEFPLKQREQQMLDVLSVNDKISINELNKVLQIKNSLPHIKNLIEMGAVEISEELKNKYKPKLEQYVSITDEHSNNNALEITFKELSRAKKQLDLLMFYLQYSKFFSDKFNREISKKELLEKSGISGSILNQLVEKKIFQIHIKKVGSLG